MTRTPIAAASIIALALIAGCAPKQEIPPRTAYGATATTYTGTGPTVAVLGDSLTVQTWNLLYTTLTTDHAVKVSAWTGEGFDGGRITDTLGTPVMFNAATEYATSTPTVAVIALGTNTVWANGNIHIDDIELALTRQAEAIAAFGTACLVWTNLPTNPGATGWNPEWAQRLNDNAATWADVTIDWAGALQADPSLVAADRVHTTPAGTRERARLTAEAVRSC